MEEMKKLLGNRSTVIGFSLSTMSTNKWTWGGTDGKDIVSPLAVEAVAYNGASAADFIFINGNIA